MSLFNKLVVSSLPFIPKSVVGKVSKRYIAGSRLVDAVRTVKRLNALGCMATLDLLGEDIFTNAEAEATLEAVLQIYPAIHSELLDSNVSIKPTQFGLRVDKEMCYRNVAAVASGSVQNSTPIASPA